MSSVRLEGVGQQACCCLPLWTQMDPLNAFSSLCVLQLCRPEKETRRKHEACNWTTSAGKHFSLGCVLSQCFLMWQYAVFAAQAGWTRGNAFSQNPYMHLKWSVLLPQWEDRMVHTLHVVLMVLKPRRPSVSLSLCSFFQTGEEWLWCNSPGPHLDLQLQPWNTHALLRLSEVWISWNAW